jgi:hypothetical protein
VEWVFKEITQQFAYLSWKREQKVFLKALGEEYSVGVLLHNAHVCLHHPQIPQFFERENGHLVRPFDDGALFHPPGLLSARGWFGGRTRTGKFLLVVDISQKLIP